MIFPKLIIGWQEWVVLPGLNIPGIRAKIDTGAKTSSLHAYHIEYFTKKRQDFVRFDVHPIRRNQIISKTCEMPIIDTRTVKSSSGEKEKRPVIKTILSIDGNQWEIELNLTNRDYMGSRMLLGREALDKHVLVNPGASYIHGKISDADAIKIYKEYSS